MFKTMKTKKSLAIKARKLFAIALSVAMIVSFAACGGTENNGGNTGKEEETVKTASIEELLAKYEGSHSLVLSSTKNSDGSYTNTAVLDGQNVTEYDYTWHADPSKDYGEVKNAPAEYYTGTKPSGDDAAYIAHDIAYYPELDQAGFKQINYDGDPEYAYYYTAEGYENYIFATLPTLRNGFPSDMMHSEDEAYANSVLHIAQAGTYIVSGTWHGQILIDLGDSDDTFTDENAKVKLVLAGADVECSVAPALIFYSAYECDNTWEDKDEHDENTDLSNAGAQVIVADGSENNFTGANVYRMLKAKFKSDDDTGVGAAQKKMRKTDAAFYSYVSMLIDGEENDTGILNVTSTTFEGLDTELHLTIAGGNINIFSQDDGINCNEDDVSVVTINGGTIHILAGLGSEGDGIDSNGYLVINGGTVISAANPASDSGLDSDCGSYINGGYVLAMGSTMDWPESKSSQATMNLQFASSQSSDEAIIVTTTDGSVKFAYDPDSDEIAGSKIRSYQGAVISCPEFEIGQTYNVYVGGNVTGTDKGGLYDAKTVTAFDGGVMQVYTSSDAFNNGHGGPGNFGGQMPSDLPEGFNPEDIQGEWGKDGKQPGGNFGGQNGNPPEKPDTNSAPTQTTDTNSAPTQTTDGAVQQMPNGGGFNGQMPDGISGGAMQRPDGNFGGGQMPSGGGFNGQMPDGISGGAMQKPDGNFGGGNFDPNNFGAYVNGGSTDLSNASSDFLLEDAVNCFSGVQDKSN